MTTLAQAYDDLRFTKAQLYFTDAEYASIAKEFFGNEGPSDAYDDRDRAFLQAALFVAVDKSEKAGLMFEIWKSFVSAAPSQSLTKLMKKLITSGAKYAFKKYVDDDPKYSAVGRAGVQYGPFATQWRLRVGVGDNTLLDNFMQHTH